MNSKCPTVKAKAVYSRLIRIGKCEGWILIGVIFFLVVCVNFVVLVCLFVLECNKYTLCCANILSVSILRREHLKTPKKWKVFSSYSQPEFRSSLKRYDLTLFFPVWRNFTWWFLLNQSNNYCHDSFFVLNLALEGQAFDWEWRRI